MWSSRLGGRTLHFRLAAINNQNFIMQDLETGTWWQQVTGEALLGPLAGQRLAPAPAEEVSFALWRSEHPDTLVMAPDPQYRDAYLPEDWEDAMRSVPVPEALHPLGDLESRALVIGLVITGTPVAYPMSSLTAQTPIADRIGGVDLLLVCAADGSSVRAFRRLVDGRVLDLYARPAGDGEVQLVDMQTGSSWNFAGEAVEGPLAGKRLIRIPMIRDYWFDWVGHHPDTRLYRAGAKLP